MVILAVSALAFGQASREARMELLRTVIAEQAAARVPMPFGSEGVELKETGEINDARVQAELKRNGRSVEPGQIVAVTKLDFNDNSIEIELNGGGKNKRSFWERIEVGMGSRTTPIGQNDASKAKGSKVVLRFTGKVPEDLTPAQLKLLLDPVLDFNKRNFMKTGIDALPPEFQVAVKAKEARIGMDRDTVLMAMGRPDDKIREEVNGVEQEDWIYYKPGLRAEFVTFESGVVIRIKKY